jgi:hypothetical protein
VGDFSEEFQGVGFFLEGVGVGVGVAVEGVGFGLEFEGLWAVWGGDELAGDGEAGAGVEVGFYAVAGDFIVGEYDLEGAEGGAIGDFGEADGFGGAAGAYPAAYSEGLV